MSDRFAVRVSKCGTFAIVVAVVVVVGSTRASHMAATSKRHLLRLTKESKKSKLKTSQGNV